MAVFANHTSANDDQEKKKKAQYDLAGMHNPLYTGTEPRRYEDIQLANNRPQAYTSYTSLHSA